MTTILANLTLGLLCFVPFGAAFLALRALRRRPARERRERTAARIAPRLWLHVELELRTDAPPPRETRPALVDGETVDAAGTWRVVG